MDPFSIEYSRIPTLVTLCASIALGLAVLAHLIHAISDQIHELLKIQGTDITKP